MKKKKRKEKWKKKKKKKKRVLISRESRLLSNILMMKNTEGYILYIYIYTQTDRQTHVCIK